MSFYRHIFGPAPSRRFGRSLGVDLTPMKTCTMDCVFCQLGRTTRRTAQRRAYVPTADVKAELTRWSRERTPADYVTLSGAGEPTLHADFGEILAYAAEATSLPAALLTNGSLLYRKEVRAAARQARVVKASLCAWDEASYRRIHRPHPRCSFEQHMAGLRAFREKYAGKIWLEVFLIEEINTAIEAVERIARRAESVAPDRIHLNFAARPPAETFVHAPRRARLEALAALFRPRATVIDEYARATVPELRLDEARVLDLLRRRPCTLRQLAAAFERHPNEISKYLGHLSRAGQIGEQRIGGETFYRGQPSQEREFA